MLSFEEINHLGNACNTTFGKQSVNGIKLTDEVYSVFQQYNECSIKCTIGSSDCGEKNTLSINYTAICHFADESSFQQQKQKYENEAIQAIDRKIGEIKENFKKSAGRSLKLGKKENDDSIELIQSSIYAARRTAYYRYNVIIEIN